MSEKRSLASVVNTVSRLTGESFKESRHLSLVEIAVKELKDVVPFSQDRNYQPQIDPLAFDDVIKVHVGSFDVVRLRGRQPERGVFLFESRPRAKRRSTIKVEYDENGSQAMWEVFFRPQGNQEIKFWYRRPLR